MSLTVRVLSVAGFDATSLLCRQCVHVSAAQTLELRHCGLSCDKFWHSTVQRVRSERSVRESTLHVTMAHRRHTVYVIFRALRARNLNASRTDNSLYTIVCVRVCVCVCVIVCLCACACGFDRLRSIGVHVMHYKLTQTISVTLQQVPACRLTVRTIASHPMTITLIYGRPM